MLVKLNAFRGDDRPGDVVDLPDADAETLIAHGAAVPAEDAETDKAVPAARTVSGSAGLAAASGTDTAAP